jgi:hypothetical protein
MRNEYSLYHLKQTKIIFLFSLAISISFILIFFQYLFYGFCYTDESYYLQVIKNPWLDEYGLTQFGLIYYPLFNLVDHSIGLLRSINAIIYLFIYTVLSYLYLSYFLPPYNTWPKTWRWLLAWLLAGGSLTVYALWLPTPNYNMLNAQALAITLIGMLAIQATGNVSDEATAEATGNTSGKVLDETVEASREVAAKAPGTTNQTRLWAWALIGLGGFLCFMAKPPSAAMLAFFVLVWAWFTSNFKPKGLIVAVGTSLVLLIVSALILNGSISANIEHYQKALAGNKLYGENTLTNLFHLDFEILIQFITFPTLVLFNLFAGFGVILTYASEKNDHRLLAYILGIALLAILALIFLPSLRAWSVLIFPGHLLYAPVLGASLYQLYITSKDQQKFSQSKLAWFAFFLFIPLIYSIGTSNHIYFPLSSSSFFIFLAFFTYIIIQKPRNVFLKLGVLLFLSQLIIILIIFTAWKTPYSQAGPLWTYQNEVAIPKGGHKLSVSSLSSKFIGEWYAAAERGGYVTGTPIIEMTGRLPGAQYILGGFLPTVPWQNSNYAGAEEGMRDVLMGLPCDVLAKAWIITDANGTDILNPAVLSQAGLEYRQDYAAVGLVEYPLAIGNRTILRLLALLAPKRPPAEMTEICLSRRANQLQSNP